MTTHELTRAIERVQSSDVSSLMTLSDALGSAEDVSAVAIAATGWIRSILGDEATISLRRPDRADRLRIVRPAGGPPRTDDGSGRRRAIARRAAYTSGIPARIELDDVRVVAMLPLRCGSHRLGIVEVVAPAIRLEMEWDVLLAGASQLGVALDTEATRAKLRRRVETLERTSSLGASLVGAGSAEEAVRVAVRFVSERFHVPVVGWSRADGWMHSLVSASGVGQRRFRRLLEELSTLPPWGSLGPTEREDHQERFRKLTGVHRVMVLDAGDAVLLMGRPRGKQDGSVGLVGEMLAEVMRILEHVAVADMATERLDQGIAWTAHELRGPLLGIRSSLGLILARQPWDPAERAVLTTSLNELDQLTGSAEAILAWAAGDRPATDSEADLVRIVDDVVAASHLESRDERPIVVAAPERAIARFDPNLLRTVVSNLIRNALAYSFRGTKVEVDIEPHDDHVELRVSDEGPTIPVEEQELIFEPYARGRMADSGRAGSGLGLFIAKELVEAQGGRIWVRSDRGTTTFSLWLPVGGRDVRRFAS